MAATDNLEAKVSSPHISLTRIGATARLFADENVEVDLPRLEADIASGRVYGSEITLPEQLQAGICASIDEIVGRHVPISPNLKIEEVRSLVDSLALKKAAAEDVEIRLEALIHTRRDSECLVTGRIPAEYISRA